MADNFNNDALTTVLTLKQSGIYRFLKGRFYENQKRGCSKSSDRCFVTDCDYFALELLIVDVDLFLFIQLDIIY